MNSLVLKNKKQFFSNRGDVFAPLAQEVLSQSELERLKKHFEVIQLPGPSVLFYENQIPPAAFIPLGPGISLYRKNQNMMELPPGTLIGLDSMLMNRPSKATCKASRGIELLVIDKTSAFQIIENAGAMDLHFLLKFLPETA